MKILTVFYSGVMSGLLLFAFIGYLGIEPISFYDFYHVLHYEDQKDRVTKLSGHCTGKDCAIITSPTRKGCNVTGVIDCYHEYSIPFNIQTYWITKT